MTAFTGFLKLKNCYRITLTGLHFTGFLNLYGIFKLSNFYRITHDYYILWDYVLKELLHDYILRDYILQNLSNLRDYHYK